MAARSKSVERVMQILELLVTTNDGLTLTALSNQTGIPLATCGVIMETLESIGYASRDVVGRKHLWRPTLSINRLGAQVIAHLDVPAVAQRHLDELVARTQMPAHLGVLDGQQLVYVAKVSAPGFFQFDTYVGKASPFNLTALGRAIAAHLPDDRLSPMLADLPVGAGPKGALGSADALVEELRKVRKVGYAVEDEVEIANVACIAAPIFDARGGVVASIGVTWFARELKGARRIAVIDDVVAAAGLTSKDLGERQRYIDRDDDRVSPVA
jgi:IclR family acetate operon transcriptional repressor